MRAPLLAAALFALAGCHRAPSEPKHPQVVVLATGDVWGQVEPCG